MMRHHDLKTSLGGKGLFDLYVTLLFIIEGSQDRNSNRAGTWRQELIQRLRSAAYWLSLFPYSTQVPGIISPILGWGLPHQLLVKKGPIGLPWAGSYEYIFSNSLSQMTLTWVKLT